MVPHGAPAGSRVRQGPRHHDQSRTGWNLPDAVCVLRSSRRTRSRRDEAPGAGCRARWCARRGGPRPRHRGRQTRQRGASQPDRLGDAGHRRTCSGGCNHRWRDHCRTSGACAPRASCRCGVADPAAATGAWAAGVRVRGFLRAGDGFGRCAGGNPERARVHRHRSGRRCARAVGARASELRAAQG